MVNNENITDFLSRILAKKNYVGQVQKTSKLKERLCKEENHVQSVFFVCTLIECIVPEYRKTINGASKQKKIVLT